MEMYGITGVLLAGDGKNNTMFLKNIDLWHFWRPL
jgi:hypothetical protein